MARRNGFWGLVALATMAAAPVACTFSTPEPVLDTRAVLESFDWWDNRDWDWYEAFVPFFDSPDLELNATYYYRWEVLTKHLTYGSPETGYTFTEFIDRPFWSGAFGSISCPLGHQFYELRWLKDRQIIEDFARYWFETPGAQPRSYSNWYGDAMWATYEVLGDRDLLRTVYPHMEAQVAGWTEERWDPEHGMYRWVGAWDGMETNINSRLTDDPFGGGEGYRPTLNSYLFADLSALARTASLFGETKKAAEYAARASALKTRVQDELWDPEREFFFHQFARDEKGGIKAKTLTYQSGPYAGNPHGRELIGYVPWQFNLPDPGYEAAWKFLMDPQYFWAPFGPTGVEQGDPQFYVSPRCCEWSGNAWPYATTQTLEALANLLNNYDQDVVTPDDYSRLLGAYTRTQRLLGRPYVAEAADPFTGSWAGHNSFYHSEHYLHSGFVDLVITGLVGLRPQAGDTLTVNPLVPEEWDFFALQGVDYHGHALDIVWDRAGSRYGKGSGLTLYLDGDEILRSPVLEKVVVPIPPPVKRGSVRLRNFAVNNGGLPFPSASASSSLPTAPPSYAVDGNRWYHRSPPNRWTGELLGPSPVWFQVDFGAPRPITEVTLYFLDGENGPAVEATGEEEGSGFPFDQVRSGVSVLPPDHYEVRYWDEETSGWREVPDQRRTPQAPEGRRANHVRFPELSTTRIQVMFHPREGARAGLTELEAWGPGDLSQDSAPLTAGNLAWKSEDGEYPRIRASFSNPSDPPEAAVDGRIAFTRYSHDRWTAYTSPHPEDWLELEFRAPVSIGRMELFLYGDGRGIAAPESYRLERWTGERWESVPFFSQVPEVPTAWAVNTTTFEPVEAERVRIVFRHALPATTGVTELRLWPE